MKLLSWNVNGIRAALGKGLAGFINTCGADVICLQETKAHEEQVNLEEITGYHRYFNSARRRGYSGTAVFSRTEPLSVSYGLGIPEHDEEGRVITCEYPGFYLVTVYTPNAGAELVRLEYRQRWDVDFLAYLQDLETKKPVIICGDLNCAHTPIDLKNPKPNEHNPGYTIEEREGFSRYLDHGFIDTFRSLHPDEPGHYSWWSYRFQARAKDIGWRLDYFCISKSLQPRLRDAFILKDVMGSDHCPVGIDLAE